MGSEYFQNMWCGQTLIAQKLLHLSLYYMNSCEFRGTSSNFPAALQCTEYLRLNHCNEVFKIVSLIRIVHAFTMCTFKNAMFTNTVWGEFTGGWDTASNTVVWPTSVYRDKYAIRQKNLKNITGTYPTDLCITKVVNTDLDCFLS